MDPTCAGSTLDPSAVPWRPAASPATRAPTAPYYHMTGPVRVAPWPNGGGKVRTAPLANSPISPIASAPVFQLCGSADQPPRRGLTLPRSLVPAPPSCAPFLTAPSDDPTWLVAPDWQQSRRLRQAGSQPQSGISRSTALQLLHTVAPAVPQAGQPQQCRGVAPAAAPTAAAVPVNRNSRACGRPDSHSPTAAGHLHASSAPALSRRASADHLSDADEFTAIDAAPRSASWPSGSGSRFR